MTTGNRPLRPRLQALLVPVALLGAGLALPPSAAPAPPAAGEPPTETYYESVDVDVVNVEVVATDRSGRPVAGLDKDSFELFEDGKPVSITNFFRSAEATSPTGAAATAAASTSGTPAAAGQATAAAGAAHPAVAAAAAPPPPDQVFNFAVFVDEESLTPVTRRPILAGIQEFLKSHIGPADHVILADYNGGLKVTQPSTSDPAALTAAIAKLMATVPHGTARSAAAGGPTFGQRFGETTGDANSLAAEVAQEDAEMANFQGVQRAQTTLATLGDFISSLAGLPGRKALVLVSGVFPVENGEPLLKRLAEHANANRVTIYVLGATETKGAVAADTSTSQALSMNADLAQGITSSSTPVSARPNADTDNLIGALHTVAERTGGRIAAGLINPTSFFATLHDDQSVFYSLGFSPAHKHDGKVHQLAVKVKGPRGVELRYRDTYEDRSGDQRTAAETVSTLVLGGGENPLGVELSVEPALAAGKGKSTVPVVVHVPIAKLVLIPQERFHEGKLTLFVATRDGRGRVSTLHRLAAPVHVANEKLMSALGESVAFRVEVAVAAAGEQTIAIGVRDEVGHVDSTATLPWSPTRTAARSGSPIPRPPGR